MKRSRNWATEPVAFGAAWVGVGIALAIAIGAGLADWRRHRRADLDRIGMLDWRTVQVLALIAAAMCGTIAFA